MGPGTAAAGIFDGHMRQELGFVADDGVKVERRIAGAVLIVGPGRWRTNNPRVFLPWNLL